VAASLDYSVRVSDKINYVSPTRGQLGNALKCVWALPYVTSEDQHGLVEVDACGRHHRIQISGSNQDPQIVPTTTKSRVKNGTNVKVTWPGIASLQADSETRDYYKAVSQFACLNPHATFRLRRPDENVVIFPASDKDWQKWRTDQPTSAHWYSPECFHNLVTAYVSNGQKDKSVREFVSEFDGLRGSQYQRKVIEEAKVSGQSLGDLTGGAIVRLLEAMQKATRPVLPKHLGIIGEKHLRQTLLALGISKNSFEYKKKLGIEDGLPFIVESAFGVKKEHGDQRDLFTGLNFSPTFRVPSEHLERVLEKTWIDDDDPVVLVVHQVTPQLRFTSLGKGEIAEEKAAIRQALSYTVERVTRRYTKIKRRALRYHDQRIKQEHLDEIGEQRSEKRSEKEEIKRAAYQVMPEAYLMASGDNSLPANARQIMCSARKLVLEIIAKCWSNSNYFTQTLLPDYQKENPEQTADWRVFYDSRGHFREPHTGTRFGIGTMEVREYRKTWRSNSTHTHGPANRFRYALFIEKEGFDALIDASQIAERFDLAFLSTKGMSVTASRELTEELSNADVTTLVAHDFDFSGLGIFHTLGHDTRRYEFGSKPRVVDIGLRLADVQAMGLDTEPYVLQQEKDPKIKLVEYGALPEEIEFLIGSKGKNAKGYYWNGTRVELNAMTSVQFIRWLERKLIENGVEKLVPEIDVLGPIWQEGQRVGAYEAFKATEGERVRAIEAQLHEAKAQLERDFDAQYKIPPTPRDLPEQVKYYLRINPLLPWDAAIVQIAAGKA